MTKNLGPDVQNSRGNFLNVARVVTYVRRIVYVELLNSESWYLGIRAVPLGRGVFFDPTGPKSHKLRVRKRILFW